MCCSTWAHARSTSSVDQPIPATCRIATSSSTTATPPPLATTPARPCFRQVCSIAHVLEGVPCSFLDLECRRALQEPTTPLTKPCSLLVSGAVGGYIAIVDSTSTPIFVRPAGRIPPVPQPDPAHPAPTSLMMHRQVRSQALLAGCILGMMTGAPQSHTDMASAMPVHRFPD